jgi:hypothetical protein
MNSVLSILRILFIDNPIGLSSFPPFSLHVKKSRSTEVHQVELNEKA